VTAQLTQVDADEKADAAQITAGQAALDTAITNLTAQINAGAEPDLTELLAAQSVLAGDHPTLEAAVAALTADPNVTPAPSTTPAPATPEPAPAS
jgi:hypothetical protein